jgi:hypothetical protein
MMTRKPSAAFASAKYAIAAPLIVLLFAAFATPIKQVSAAAVAELTPVVAAVSTAIVPNATPETPILPEILPFAVAPLPVLQMAVLPVNPPDLQTNLSSLVEQLTTPQLNRADTIKPRILSSKEVEELSKKGLAPPNPVPGHCYARCPIPEKSTFTEWQEVVCSDKITEKFIKSLQIALREKGYTISDSDAITTEMKKALTDFQQKNKLPVGNLNYDCLRALMSDFKEYEVVGPQKK